MPTPSGHMATVVVSFRPGPRFADVADVCRIRRSFRDLSAALHGRRRRTSASTLPFAVTCALCYLPFFLTTLLFYFSVSVSESFFFKETTTSI